MRRILLIFSMVLLSLPARATDSTSGSLILLADEELMLPLAQISRAYASEMRSPVTVVVKDEADIQQQVEQGIEAHLLITANTAIIKQLSERGLTDVSSRKIIGSGQLALVSAGNLAGQAAIATRISFASILAATPDLPVYTNAPDTLEGQRANALLYGQPFSQTLLGRMQVKPTHEEVMAALSEAPSLGLVLTTNLMEDGQVRVVSLLPDAISPSVDYEAVVLAGESMEEARKFSNYLSGKTARGILQKYGYRLPLR